MFFPVHFEGFICIRIITVQISIPALSSPAQRACFFFVSSKQGVLVSSFPSDRQAVG